MQKTTAFIATVCAIQLAMTASQAKAQNRPFYDTATPPTVSPYLNLGYSPNGFSNYQSLVKPMLEERERLSRQGINIQRLQRRMRDAQDLAREAPTSEPQGREVSSRKVPARPYMNYSHYFRPLP